MQVQSSARIYQLELFKNFEQPVTIDKAVVVIRSVSTRTGQVFIMSKDLASVLTSEKDPKKLRRFLNNAREKVQRGSNGKESFLMNESGETTTLVGALTKLKVCMHCFIFFVG